MQLLIDGNGRTVPVFRFGTNQNVAYGLATPTPAAFGANTRVIRVIATTACYIAIGAAPVATANDPMLAANTETYLQVKPGEKLSALQVAAAGTISVTEMA